VADVVDGDLIQALGPEDLLHSTFKWVTIPGGADRQAVIERPDRQDQRRGPRNTSEGGLIGAQWLMQLLSDSSRGDLA
jgi:hypothetical protein